MEATIKPLYRVGSEDVTDVFHITYLRKTVTSSRPTLYNSGMEAHKQPFSGQVWKKVFYKTSMVAPIYPLHHTIIEASV
jgi:hypothetical protein